MLEHAIFGNSVTIVHAIFGDSVTPNHAMFRRSVTLGNDIFMILSREVTQGRVGHAIYGDFCLSLITRCKFENDNEMFIHVL